MVGGAVLRCVSSSGGQRNGLHLRWAFGRLCSPASAERTSAKVSCATTTTHAPMTTATTWTGVVTSRPRCVTTRTSAPRTGAIPRKDAPSHRSRIGETATRTLVRRPGCVRPALAWLCRRMPAPTPRTSQSSAIPALPTRLKRALATRSAIQRATAPCLVENTGVSADCASCYGAVVICIFDNCLHVCAPVTELASMRRLPGRVRVRHAADRLQR